MDEQLKRRLTGATILVTLMVIFVPMLFEDKSTGPAKAPEEIPALPKTIEETPMELPRSASDVAPAEPAEAPAAAAAKPARKSGYQIVPLDETQGKPAQAEKSGPPAAGAGAATAGAEPDAADEEGEDVPLEDPGAPPAPGAPAPKYVPAVERPRADAPRDVPEAADETTPPSKKSKKAAGTDKSKPASKPESRKAEARPAEVDGGVPKSSASKPAVAAAPAKQGTKVGQPKAAGPAKAGAKGEGQAAGGGTPSAWSVQAGTFNSESNARALAEKLRKQNLPAHVRVIKRDSGTVYRVTVGPDLNHSKAQDIQKKVENAGGVKAIVVPRQ